MNMTIKSLAFAAIAACMLFANSVQAEITPASLGSPDDEKYFLKFIGFPETHGDAKVNLDCYMLVRKNGKLEGDCYVKNNWDPDFAYAVVQGMKKGRMTPAFEGKKQMDMVVQFQTLFEKVGEERTLKILLNTGLPDNTEEYGENHIAAQRVFGYEPWRKNCPKRAEWLVNARAHVNDQGVASSVDLEHVKGIVPTGSCTTAIIETIEKARYSPTLADGVAVPSSYVEPFGN
jgi:hypothetical protein